MQMISDVRKAFYTFAVRKPADEAYDYVGKSGPCAFHQFLVAMGYDCALVYPGQYRVNPLDDFVDMPEGVEFALQGPNGDRCDWTWGQIVGRLEALA